MKRKAIWRWWSGDPLPEDTTVGVGHRYLWQLPDDHPFLPAAKVHDEEFDLQRAGIQKKSRAQVDKELLKNMLCIVNREKMGLWWRCKAFTFYGIARAVGKYIWVKNP